MAAGEPPNGPGPQQRRGWWIAAGLLVAVAVVTAAVIWFLPVPWSTWLLVILSSAGLLGVLLLSPTPRLMKNSFWRNRPAAVRLGNRLHARWQQWRPLLAVLAGLGVLAGVVLLVWQVPPALYGYVTEPKDRATVEASTRTGMIAGFAGLAALIGLSYTARSYQVTKQGHLTDRYTKAIDQLGNKDSLDVRLGGIYALERIAVDSERDHPTVVEVLGAYVRQHTDLTQCPPAGAGGRPKPAPSRPAADMQAAVSVLGRLPSRYRVSRGDLTGAWLAGAQLGRAKLAGAKLAGADLVKADLTSAQLSGADLTHAHLDGADLTHAHLDGANLTDAMLDGANLAAAKNLTQQQLDSAHGDAQTKLPAELQRPAHWSAGPAADQ